MYLENVELWGVRGVKVGEMIADWPLAFTHLAKIHGVAVTRSIHWRPSEFARLNKRNDILKFLVCSSKYSRAANKRPQNE